MPSCGAPAWADAPAAPAKLARQPFIGRGRGPCACRRDVEPAPDKGLRILPASDPFGPGKAQSKQGYQMISARGGPTRRNFCSDQGIGPRHFQFRDNIRAHRGKSAALPVARLGPCLMISHPAKVCGARPTPTRSRTSCWEIAKYLHFAPIPHERTARAQAAGAHAEFL